MIVSWEWLGQYVALEMPLEDLAGKKVLEIGSGVGAL